MRLWMMSILLLMAMIPSKAQNDFQERSHLPQFFIGVSTSTHQGEGVGNYLSVNTKIGYHLIKKLRLGLQYRYSKRDVTGISHVPWNRTSSLFSTHEFAPYLKYVHQWPYKIKPTLQLELGYGRIQYSKDGYPSGELDPEIRPYFFTGGAWLGTRYFMNDRIGINLQAGIRKFIYPGKILYGLPGYYSQPYFLSAQVGIDFIIFKKQRRY